MITVLEIVITDNVSSLDTLWTKALSLYFKMKVPYEYKNVDIAIRRETDKR